MLSNAFLNGALYKSPQNYKDKLSEKGEHSSNFSDSLRQLGQKDDFELKEFESSAQKTISRKND